MTVHDDNADFRRPGLFDCSTKIDEEKWPELRNRVQQRSYKRLRSKTFVLMKLNFVSSKSVLIL